MAVVLTLVTNKNKYTQTKEYKNTVNTSTYITKTPTHYQNTHTITKTPTQLPKHPHNYQNTLTISKTPTQLPKHPHNFQNTHIVSKTPSQFPKHPLNYQNTHTFTKTPTRLRLKYCRTGCISETVCRCLQSIKKVLSLYSSSE